MTRVRLVPGPVTGRVRAPPSKSYTHRALVVGHLSGRRFRVEDPLDADDTRATADALGPLGSTVDFDRGAWVVRPGRKVGPRHATVDCGESGTTLRFLSAVAARGGRPIRFNGRARLGARPMRGLLRALSTLGASVRVAPAGLPIDICGPLRGGRVRLDASDSSQFVSSLLLTLPTLDEDSHLELTGEVVSAPYIDATLALLRHHGVRVTRRPRSYFIRGGQRYHGSRFRVPGDASSAAYFWAAAALAEGPVRVDGISEQWPQADRAILPLLRAFGAHVSSGRDWVRVTAGGRHPFSVDLTDTPDLYPLVGVLAAVAPGRSRISGAPHVAHKESDRRAGTVRLIRALGASVRETRAGLVVTGILSPKAIRLSHLEDHRMVMSAAVGALAGSGPSQVGPAEATRKSFPEFWLALRKLGAEVREL